MHTTLLLLLRIVLTVQGFLCFHMNFKVVPRSVKNVIVILMLNVLILQIPLVISVFIILQIHEYNCSLYLLESSSNVSSISKFSS